MIDIDQNNVDENNNSNDGDQDRDHHRQDNDRHDNLGNNHRHDNHGNNHGQDNDRHDHAQLANNPQHDHIYHSDYSNDFNQFISSWKDALFKQKLQSKLASYQHSAELNTLNAKLHMYETESLKLKLEMESKDKLICQLQADCFAKDVQLFVLASNIASQFPDCSELVRNFSCRV